jgi:anti-anti-sigma regulatory factor
MLSVNEEWRGDVALLELVGDFTAGNMQPFYEKVTQLKLLRRWKVLLRLGKVTRIDEADLGEIMRLTTGPHAGVAASWRYWTRLLSCDRCSTRGWGFSISECAILKTRRSLDSGRFRGLIPKPNEGAAICGLRAASFGVTDRIRELLRVTKMSNILVVFDTGDAEVQRFEAADET